LGGLKYDNLADERMPSDKSKKKCSSHDPSVYAVIDVVYCQHLIVTSPGWEHSGLPISLCIMYPLLSK
jgi:hypothetical protein